jgi:hypothetical protein
MFMVCLTTLSVTQDFMASNGGMIIEQWTRKHAEGSSHELIWNASSGLYNINRAVNVSICLHYS